MSNNISKKDNWDYQIQSKLPHLDVISFLDESQMQLVWQRTKHNTLVYAIEKAIAVCLHSVIAQHPPQAIAVCWN